MTRTTTRLAAALGAPDEGSSTAGDRWAAVHRISIALALAAVLAQILYPQTEGGTRDTLTVLNVVVFSAASLAHAWSQHGPRTALAVGAVFAGGGLTAEVVGVATGFPFGTYHYADRLGPMVGEVPLVIPLAWTMLGYPALVVARLMTARRWLGTTIAAGALTAWDLFLDPQMVAEGYWEWSGAGPHLIDTIPVTNYLAWFGVSWLMMAALWHLTAGWTTRAVDVRVPVALYLWTWAGSVVAHAVYFDLPQSALYGGVGMGLFVIPAAWALAAQSARHDRVR